jgi:multimeric flavodoxin WrbA
MRAVYVNATLEREVAQSHTARLLDASASMMRKQDIAVDTIHLLSHSIAQGVYPDMTEHGWQRDDWPALWKRILDAHILVIGTPIWLGEQSSACRVFIERLYGMSGELNDKGQSIFYGKVGGCVVTGNEDGIKNVAKTVTYSLNHLGYTIPPQADCGWIGEAGPGPSYGDDLGDGKRAGFDNDFTKRNTTIMTWNLMHFAHMLAETPIPNEGNDRNAWNAGARFRFENPEYRS